MRYTEGGGGTMSTRALVATDLSDASMMMVENLSLLHDFQVESIILLQCYEYPQVADELYPVYTDLQKETLQRQEELLRERGFTIKVETSFGHAKQEIRRIAAEQDVSLIVVGSQGRSLLGGAFLGGVAFEVMLHTPRPLLIYRLLVDKMATLRPSPVHPDGILSHPLFAVDFSSANRKAFDHFLLMVSTQRCRKVTLAHVVDPVKDLDEELKTIARQRLTALEDEVRSVGVPEVESMVLSGHAHKKLLEVIDTDAISLAVLGTVGHTFLHEVFAGSVSQYVARHAGKPVYLIPQMD